MAAWTIYSTGQSPTYTIIYLMSYVTCHVSQKYEGTVSLGKSKLGGTAPAGSVVDGTVTGGTVSMGKFSWGKCCYWKSHSALDILVNTPLIRKKHFTILPSLMGVIIKIIVLWL